MASVTYKNVVKRYGDMTVIKDLSMEIKDKEFVVFVGFWVRKIYQLADVSRVGRD